MVPWPQLLEHHCLPMLDVFEVPSGGKAVYLPCLQNSTEEPSRDWCAEDRLVPWSLGGQ